MTSVVIVCAMEVERRMLRPAFAERRNVEIHVCGIGPGAVGRFAERAPAARLLVFAGVAGGLVDEARVGEARAIHEVHLPDGEVIATSTWGEGPTWRVAGSDVIVPTPRHKRELAARSGASIVDMESHAFVREATRRGWHFAIVRGVCDAIDDEIPPEIEHLLDANGRTRVLSAVALIARKPMLLPRLRQFERRTKQAMNAVVPIVRSLIEGGPR